MIRIGLIDGALAASLPGLAAQRAFCDPDGTPLAQKHATAMATTVRSHEPQTHFVNAVVFPGGLSTTCRALCDALEWLTIDPPEVILCSFGMARSSVELCVLVARLQAAGSLIIASAPARGDPVFPAAFPDVLSVQGDARCQPGELSRLDLPHATFGACSEAIDAPDIRGASAAAAHLAGHVASLLAEGEPDPAASLTSFIRYHGRERKQAVPA
ncbi:hypothetical protein FMN50_26075 [Rhodobacterales bacterium]|nr:hypothetical protein FMN50_26075 [Rhodobacterales bacterium]